MNIQNATKMKIAKVTLITLVFMLGAVVGCKESFLEILPTGSLDETKLTSEPGLEGSLIGVYHSLGGRGGFYGGSDNWFWGDVMAAAAYKGSNSGDQAQTNEIFTFKPQTTNGTVQEKYQDTYEGIARANNTLKLCGEADPIVPQAVVTRVMAETRFLRAHYYFELKRLFNNTPYVDETWDGVAAVANDQDLWPKIEADLQYAVSNLPSTQDDAGRANKYAAEAYLAKVYLYEKKYSDAKTLFDDVIANGETANGQKYGLMAKFTDLFDPRNDNNKESVFAMQATAGSTNVNNANPDFVLNFPYSGAGDVPAGCCGFNQPSFDMANSYRTSSGLPLLDGSYDDAANALKTDQGILSNAAFTPDAGPVDPRLDYTIGRRGIPYLDWGPHKGFDWVRDQTYAGPYAPKKFVFPKADDEQFVDHSGWTPGYVAVNVELIRFADVLLMAAECEVELGNLEQARTYVNMVRARAANAADFVTNADGSVAANYVISQYPTAWTDQNVARDAVRMERKLELAQEGHRFFDLTRWGTAATEINKSISVSNAVMGATSCLNGANFASGKNELLPIPQNEIDLLGSDVLQQNPGY
jgi:starch-binding outer membrane protein, SusD/RagB family